MGIAVDQRHGLEPLKQVASQALEVVAAWLHVGQDPFGFCPDDSLVDIATQLVKPGPKDVNLESRCHDLVQRVVDDHHVEVLVDVQGDALVVSTSYRIHSTRRQKDV